ncbi:hypothetical protein [Mesorhizobium sp. Mes31]|uniref:hypothetical protein n=1 Tax=Mesorhizobium sp. Mes31 TaxID=2926017 RepID=UPI002117BE74|nr:hypothetical protein [Mesorhizobium sp. Mes31]
MSGIAPPRALADALPAFAHVLEKIDMRQDLKWCAVILLAMPNQPGQADIRHLLCPCQHSHMFWKNLTCINIRTGAQ